MRFLLPALALLIPLAAAPWPSCAADTADGKGAAGEDVGERGKDGAYAVTVVAKDGKNDTRQVKTGLHDAANVQVTSGVKAGERVLLAPPPASAASAASAS